MHLQFVELQEKKKKREKKELLGFVAFVPVTENVFNLMTRIKRFPDYRELLHTNTTSRVIIRTDLTYWRGIFNINRLEYLLI